MSLSSPGIGSGLDVNGIVSKLMTVESLPLNQLTQQQASYQATLSAYGNVSSAVSQFQSALAALTDPSKFQALTANATNSSVLSSSASSQAAVGSYNINVTQLAQAQSLTSAGQVSTTASIGAGASTTVTFQFGSANAGVSGNILAAGVESGGIAAGALILNGTTITTSASTNSAKALAAQINLSQSTTGVTATAQTTDTGNLAFSAVTTGVGDAYNLVVGGVTVANVGASSSLSAAQLDAAISSANASLTAAGVTVTGTAAGGNLHFTKTDGSNLDITQTLTNTSSTASGGLAGFTSGVSQGFLSSVKLSAASAITVGGSSPTTAGFTAGTVPVAGFTQDPTQSSGSITITSANNSLQGIRDAINNGNVGVTASIISDGSAAPNRLVLTSKKTGATSDMKITVSGDAAISGLLAYDPAGTQNLTQTVAGQSAALTVNGLAVTSANNAVTGAIQGVSLNLIGTGSSAVNVTRDTSSISAAVNSLVNAYNSANKTLTGLTAYDPTTKRGGPLIGDSVVQTIQSQLVRIMTAPIVGSGGTLTSLGQIGVSFQNDGTLTLDSAKLQSAITSNPNDFAGLFAANGTATDSLISFSTSTAKTTPGSYAVNVTSLAKQAVLTGNATPGLTITAGSNDQLNVTVDGVNATVTLAAGTYASASALAAQVQSAINGASAISTAGSAVTVGVNGSNQLTITSNRFGSASNVSLGGNAGTNLVGAAPTTQAGADVVGTIGGVTAVGSGQFLTGASGSKTDGLKLQITGGATGTRGLINFSQGYAYQLNNQINSYLGTSGLIAGRTTGINSDITDIQKRQADMNLQLAATQKRYLAEFTALDVLVSNLQSTQSFLTQQLTQIAANTPHG